MVKHFQEILAPGAAADDSDIGPLPGFGWERVFFRSSFGGLSGLTFASAYFGHGNRLPKMFNLFYYIGKCRKIGKIAVAQ